MMKFCGKFVVDGSSHFLISQGGGLWSDEF